MKKVITISELINIYRSALTSLMPCVDKLGVPWRMRESYDDWDNISACIFNNIICASLYSGVALKYPILRSSSNGNDISNLDYIGVRIHSNTNNVSIFLDLESIQYPLDTIIYLVVDSNGKLIEKKYIEYNDNIEFYYAKNEEGKRTIVNNIEVGY